MRVAYIATKLASEMGVRGTDLSDVFLAAALHDIGLIVVEHDGANLHGNPPGDRPWFEISYALLHDQFLFSNAAEIIRNLHTPWEDGRGAEREGRQVPLGSHILSVADTSERAIDRNVPVLRQADFVAKQISCLAGKTFHPDCVEAFRRASRPESFWLDCTSERVYSILLKLVDWIPVLLDEAMIDSIAEIVARVVDSASVWTTTHSAGVAATAVELAKRLNFSPREQSLMRAAGHFHDLGKLTIPKHVLNKADRPTADEWAAIKAHPYHTFRFLDSIGGMVQISQWAAFHHERVDGKGYPFRVGAENLPLGSRIMAVADVFAAVSEDRPYRKAMARSACIEVLEKFVQQRALDGDVVATLQSHYDEIDAVRQAERASYALKQQALAERIAACRGLTGTFAAQRPALCRTR